LSIWLNKARLHYQLVEMGNKDFELSHSRIVEIERIEAKQVYHDAVKSFSSNNYKDAKALFSQIDKTSEFYKDSQNFLTIINRIYEVKRQGEERLEKARIIEEAKSEKIKRIEEEKALKKIKADVRALFNSLMAFKDKRDFHSYGFAIGYKYNKWLKEVQRLKSTPEAHLLLINQGFVVGDLEMLGREYMGSNGKETEYSLWAKKRIRDGLR